MTDPIAPASGPRKTACLALEDEKRLPRKAGAADQDLVDAIDCNNRETFDVNAGYDYAREVFTGGFSRGNTLKGMNYGVAGALKLDEPGAGVRFHLGATAPLTDKLSFTLNGGLGIGGGKAGEVVRLGLDANLDASLKYFMNQQTMFFANAGLQGRVSFYVDTELAKQTAVEASPRFEQLKREVDAAVAAFKRDVRAAFAGSQAVIDQIMQAVDAQMGPLAAALPGALLAAIVSGDTSGVTALIAGAMNTIETRVGNIATGAGTQATAALNAAIDKLKNAVVASLRSAGNDLKERIDQIGSVGGGLGWSAEAGWRGRFAVLGTEPDLGNFGGGIFVEPSLSFYASGPIVQFGLDSPTLPSDAPVGLMQFGLAAGLRASFEIPDTTIALYVEQLFKAPVEITKTVVDGTAAYDASFGMPSAQANAGAKLTF